MEGDLHGDGLVLLLVDGDNLLHAVRGGRDDGGVAWLLPRLSRWRPAGTRVVVALDGHPAHGESGRRRVATGIEFHHAGTRTADDLIVDLLASQPFAARARCVVVTRDVDLIERARRAGGLTRSLDWLVSQLDAPGAAGGAGSTHIGQGAPPRRPGTPSGQEVERPPWRPGRGATRKRGNPRRGAKAPRQR
jgi:hypothetical protein